MNILIVDDEPTLRTVLKDLLQKEGYKIATASDGSEAIEIVQKQPFDLILLDIMMPNIDGYGVLKFVKGNYPSTKVIMLTAYSDLKHAIESKKLGADDFVGKPLMRKDLLDTIKNVFTK